jgi:hypothetical protein
LDKYCNLQHARVETVGGSNALMAATAGSVHSAVAAQSEFAGSVQGMGHKMYGLAHEL